MANLQEVKHKPVTITLADGVEREIKFTLNAMAELEERYGSVEKAFEALEQNSMKAVRCVLWAGLMHSDESLTEKQVGDLIDIRYLQSLNDSLGDAITGDLPSKEAIEGDIHPNQ